MNMLPYKLPGTGPNSLLSMSLQTVKGMESIAEQSLQHRELG